MKVVILCGGRGTRLREETEFRPKPMVTVGDRPILWHIMKHYAHFGHDDFHLALGYKSEMIRQFFLQYYGVSQDFSVDLSTGKVVRHDAPVENWNVHLIDTGQDTNTGGRVLRLKSELVDAPFLLSYGDGVSDVDINEVIRYHRSTGKLVTLTAVRPPARFGCLGIEQGIVSSFSEKPKGGEGWVNAGYMVIEPGFFDYLEDDSTGLEVLQQVAADGQVAAYQHPGYWHNMDTIRDREALEAAWDAGNPPWKVW